MTTPDFSGVPPDLSVRLAEILKFGGSLTPIFYGTPMPMVDPDDQPSVPPDPPRPWWPDVGYGPPISMIPPPRSPIWPIPPRYPWRPPNPCDEIEMNVERGLSALSDLDAQFRSAALMDLNYAYAYCDYGNPCRVFREIADRIGVNLRAVIESWPNRVPPDEHAMAWQNNTSNLQGIFNTAYINCSNAFDRSSYRETSCLLRQAAFEQAVRNIQAREREVCSMLQAQILLSESWNCPSAEDIARRVDAVCTGRTRYPIP